MREQAIRLGRLAFGLLAAVALGVQAYHVATQDASPANYFSYFTNLSNLAGAVVLLLGTRLLLPDLLRGAVVLYMTITGIVYAVLLSGYHLPLELPWVNDVLHKVMPVVYLADWLLVPPLRRIGYRAAAGWLVFPVVYLGYTLIRGRIAHWYPYPFTDPGQAPGGYGRVAVACTMVTCLFVAVAAGVVWAGNRLAGQPPGDEILAPG